MCYSFLRYYVEEYFYKRIEKVYKDIRYQPSQLTEKTIVTNMDVLLSSIESYATKRKRELRQIAVREKYRREFLGNISHEFKTPLFTVQGYISTLIDGAKDNPELLNRYLKRADKGIERLSYIVQDLDMISKLEVGNLDLRFSNFDIVALIQNVFELYELKAQHKEIKLSFDKNYTNSVWVYADPERIEQVISNLVTNSIKYGIEKGITEVSIEELTASKFIIRVTDNGQGIPKEYIPRLFERFFRVHRSGARTQGGSGLGLAIVKHIIEAHEENIYVESQEKIGSEFSFTLERASVDTLPTM